MVLIRRRLDGREAHAVLPKRLARVVGHEVEGVLAALFAVLGHVDAVLPRLIIVISSIVLFLTTCAVEGDAETEGFDLDVVRVQEQNLHAFRGGGVVRLVLVLVG